LPVIDLLLSTSHPDKDDFLDPANSGKIHDVINARPALAQVHLHGLKSHIQTDLVSELKAVSHALCRIEDAYWYLIQQMRFYLLGKGRTTEPEYPDSKQIQFPGT